MQHTGLTQQTYDRARRIIPGGTQLLSKRPELLAPQRWPAYYRQAQGCQITDLDGRTYIDMSSNAVGACLLGYADPDVNRAVINAVEHGSISSLNPHQEVELAERLLAIHGWAEQVRYCRAGGEAMTMAIRIARAATGRDRVAFCGYHGWHDWYLAANLAGGGLNDLLLPGLEPRGVPAGLRGTALPFHYNQLEELTAIVDQYGAELAAVVIEPQRRAAPHPGFLSGVRGLCDACGARLIVDEVSIGWRIYCGGAHLPLQLVPDLAVFAKALGNGFPMAAVIGRAETMEAAQSTFISSSYWTDSIGPAAALATIQKMQTLDIPGHVQHIGSLAYEGWCQLCRQHGLAPAPSPLPCFTQFDMQHPDNAALMTLFTVRMLDRGYLAASQFYPTYAHTESVVANFLDQAREVFPELQVAAEKGDAAERIGTPVRQQGFRRLT